MTAADTRPGGLSQLARCPRMLALAKQGAECRPPTVDEERYFERGNVFEILVARRFERKYGKDNIERQRVIRTSHGWLCGHADIYVRPEKLLVEVVSTVSPTGAILDFKLEQAKLYLAFDDEAENTCVYVINPSSLRREELLPVVLTASDRERIAREVASVEHALQAGGLPARVCTRPRDARRMMCSYAGPCFEGWEPPDLERLDDPTVQSTAVDRYHAKQAELDKKREYEAALERRKELDSGLAALVPEGEWVAGNLKVKRKRYKGKTTFRLGHAFKAGVWTPLDEERFGPFVSVGDPYDVVDVQRVDESAPLVDEDAFGEDTPF